jgi:hypothetical protein
LSITFLASATDRGDTFNILAASDCATFCKFAEGCLSIADSAKACAAYVAMRQALAVAQHRDALDVPLRAAEGALAGASTITSADPQAKAVAALWLSRGWIAPPPDDIARLRILGLTMTPSLAGVILMLATTLAATRTRRAAVAPST